MNHNNHIDPLLKQEQFDFFEKNGYLHLPGLLSPEDVQNSLMEISRVESELANSQVKMIKGIPVFWGNKPGQPPFIHRMPFLSCFSPFFSALIKTPAFKALLPLLPGCSRFGEFENDGFVLNRYTYTPSSKFKSVGWHTDSVRDLFYFRKIKPMLNVGIHLTQSDEHVGCLRLLPGTHKQNLWSLATHKFYYLNNKADPREIALETASGDVSIHHGQIWHRVNPPLIHEENNRERIVLYIPIIAGPFHIKSEESSTPIYHHFQKLYR